MFDMSRGLLWRDGLHVPMTPKTADVLRVLIERRGEVVDKSDLLHFVWPNTVVEENNLARHISTLRKILQERRGQHDIISTIPGHGYMFVAPVTELHDEVESERSPREDELEIGSPGLLGLPGINAAFDAAAPEAAPLTVASSRGSGRWWLAAAAVGCVAAAGIAMLVSTRSSSFTHHVDVNVRQLTFEGQLQRDPAWSPDGSALVFATDRAGNLDLYRRSMSEPVPVRLTDDPADESQADWSPDGRWLAFRSEKDKGGVYVMPAHGGPARRISDGGFYPRWSPNGNRILLTDTTPVITRGFRIVGVDGQPPRVLRPDVTSGFRSPSASWHPDGRRISIAGRQTDGSWTFVTVDIDGDGATTSAIPSDCSIASTTGRQPGTVRVVTIRTRPLLRRPPRWCSQHLARRRRREDVGVDWEPGASVQRSRPIQRPDAVARRTAASVHRQPRADARLELSVRSRNRNADRRGPASDAWRSRRVRRVGAARRNQGRVSHHPRQPSRTVGTIGRRRWRASAERELGLDADQSPLVARRDPARVSAAVVVQTPGGDAGRRDSHGWDARSSADPASPVRGRPGRLVVGQRLAARRVPSIAESTDGHLSDAGGDGRSRGRPAGCVRRDQKPAVPAILSRRTLDQFHGARLQAARRLHHLCDARRRRALDSNHRWQAVPTTSLAGRRTATPSISCQRAKGRSTCGDSGSTRLRDASAASRSA